MRSLLAVVMSAALFVSTIDAQTFAPAEAKPVLPREQAAANLNGHWDIANKDDKGRPVVEHFLILPVKGGILMCVTVDQKRCVEHTAWAGIFLSDLSRLKVIPAFPTKDPAFYMSVLDPDHLKGERGIYVRVGPGAYDVPCDAKNSARVTGEFAVMRARDAMHHYKSDELTACWMRIAANAGDARSQAMMAYFAHEGEGVPKNLREAEDWAQKSAHQQDAFGEIMMGLMYENNEVEFQNPIVSAGVIDQAYVQINRIRHEQGLPAIQQPNHQQSARGPDPRAVGAAALGILLMGALAGMSGGSSESSGNEAWRGPYDRQQQIHQDYQAGCANGDSGSCDGAGESLPEPQ